MQGRQDLGQASEQAGEPAQLRVSADLHSGEGLVAAVQSAGGSAAPQAGRLVARSLGKYQLIASLGRGGMADVLLALVSGPIGFNKLTVLKILRDDLQSSSADAVQMFVAEARLAARFSHPNVVRTYEAAQIDGRYLLAMEYLEGQTYRHVQRRAAKTCGLLLHEHLRILSQLARGLHYVHALTDFDDTPLAMVHRDVSPQNVFVTYDGEVKLLDFGIAQTRDSELPAQNRVIKGKLDYMAPEQLKREPVDARADVFALGAMLWEAISGARFAGGRTVSDFAKAQARVHGGETNIRVVQPGVPTRLAELVDDALALHPEQRLPDAAVFADTIDAYLAAVGAPPDQSLPGLMSSLFEHERSKLRALIERHLERVRAEQLEAEENTGERPFFRVAEVETSGWTAVHDLSGHSGLHETPRARHAALLGAQATEPHVSTAATTIAPVGSDLDEPTRPRARMPALPGKVPAARKAHSARPRSKVGPALLVALGALSGGVLAWFGPAVGRDSGAAAPELGVGPERSSVAALVDTVGERPAPGESAVVAEPTTAALSEPRTGALVAPVVESLAEPSVAPLVEPSVEALAEPTRASSAELTGTVTNEPTRVPLAGPAEVPFVEDTSVAEQGVAAKQLAVSAPVLRARSVPQRVIAKPSLAAASVRKAAALATPVEAKTKSAPPTAVVVVEHNPYLR